MSLFIFAVFMKWNWHASSLRRYYIFLSVFWHRLESERISSLPPFQIQYYLLLMFNIIVSFDSLYRIYRIFSFPQVDLVDFQSLLPRLAHFHPFLMFSNISIAFDIVFMIILNCK
jgi:hypothetical protein